MAQNQEENQEENQAKDPAAEVPGSARATPTGAEMAGQGPGAVEGDGAPQVQPGSKQGIDMSEGGGGGASTGGPGGPDAGSNAMPGRSNAL